MDLRENITIYTKDCTLLNEEGQIYLYCDKATSKSYVLKVQPNESGYVAPSNVLLQEFRKMVLFSAEPEIATVYYLVKVDEDNIGYVMEYIQGKNLDDYLLDNNSLSYDQAFSIISTIISGIEKSHYYGVTHGDLHRRNIMIDERGFCKIIDFIDWQATQFADTMDEGADGDLKLILGIIELFIDKMHEIPQNKFETRKLLALRTLFEKKIFDLKNINGLTKTMQIMNKSIEIIFVYEPLFLRILPILFKEININQLKSEGLFISMGNCSFSINHKPKYVSDFKFIILKEEIMNIFSVGMNFLKDIGTLIDYRINVENYNHGSVDISFMLTFSYKILDTYALVMEYGVFDLDLKPEDHKRNFAEFMYLLGTDTTNL